MGEAALPQRQGSRASLVQIFIPVDLNFAQFRPDLVSF